MPLRMTLALEFLQKNKAIIILIVVFTSDCHTQMQGFIFMWNKVKLEMKRGEIL